MLINTKLIQNYLDAAFSADEIEAALMRAGLEVEESFNLAEVLASVRIGFVRSIAPIDGTDALNLCQIDIGQAEPIPVVCGSSHEVQAGWGVPVALPGTRLPLGQVIERATVRGQDSAGMICLDGEMGMVLRGSGLQVFDESVAPGTPLVEQIDIDERLVEISVLPNRPDCLGLIGIARELAAVLGCGVVYPDTANGAGADETVDTPVAVSIADSGRCSRYLAAVFDGIAVAQSPDWLKNALLTLGARPINNVVDITNFVMFEWGNPLHAFDFESIRGAQINVRKAGDDETMKLLDNTELKLGQDDLVIADGDRPVALAGVMGGDASQTQSDTSRVLLEAAHFEPTGIRKTRRNHGLSTDSSYRFERGTDPNRMLLGAFERACALLEQVAGGKRQGAAIDCKAADHPPKSFDLPAAKVSSYLGRAVSTDEIAGALTRLEMNCETAGECVQVQTPTWRVDMDDPVVLIEDVARITGYDTLTSQAPAEVRTAGRRSPMDRLRDELAIFLSTQGFAECRTLPLVDRSQRMFFEDGQAALELVNPMKEDESVLRRSLLPALISAVDQNTRRGTGSTRFYEMDRTYAVIDGEPREQWVVAGVISGPAHDQSWDKSKPVGFFEAKGVVENLLEVMHVESAAFAPHALPGMKPGATATITSAGKTIGTLGEIDPKAIKGLNANDAVFGFEINLDAGQTDGKSKYRSLPRYPAIDRDLALIVERTTAYAEIERVIHQTIAQSGGTLTADELESLACFDRYEGKGVPEGKLSLGIRLVFRSATRTLTTDEIDRLIEAIVAALASACHAELRQ